MPWLGNIRPHRSLWDGNISFPPNKLRLEPGTEFLRRHHFDESALNKVIHVAAQQLKLTPEVSCHTQRHSFSTHFLQTGVDIRTLPQQLGHNYVKTTEIYIHVLKQGAYGVRNPFSNLAQR